MSPLVGQVDSDAKATLARRRKGLREPNIESRDGGFAIMVGILRILLLILFCLMIFPVPTRMGIQVEYHPKPCSPGNAEKRKLKSYDSSRWDVILLGRLKISWIQLHH